MHSEGQISQGKSWYRILVVLLGILFLIISSMVYITMNNMTSLLESSFEWQSIVLTQTIESSMFDSLAVGNNDAVRQQFRTLSETLPGIEVSIFDFNGRVSFSTDEQAILQSLEQRVTSSEINKKISAMIENQTEERHMVRDDTAAGASQVMVTLIRNEKRCFHCHGQSREILGGVYVRLPLDQWQAILSNAQFRLMAVGAGGFLVIFLVTAYYFKRLVNIFRRTMSRIQSTSESMVDSADILTVSSAKVTEEVVILGNRSLNALDSTEKSASNLSNIATAGREVSSQINEIAQSSEGMMTMIEKIRSAVHHNANLMKGLASAISAISRSLVENDELIKKMNLFLSSIYDDSLRGAEKSEKARANSDDVTQTFQDLLVAAKDIDDILILIEEINSQSNVLALNAEIEAARAGKAGRGFMVVASEMRQLSHQTAKATEDVSSKITALQDQVVETDNKNTKNTELISQLNEMMQSFSQSAERRKKSIQELKVYMQEIGNSIDMIANQLTTVADKSATTLNQVNEFVKYEQHMKTSIDEVAQSAGFIAQDVVTAAHAVATINEELSQFDAILEEITAEIWKTNEQGTKFFALSQSLQKFIDETKI